MKREKVEEARFRRFDKAQYIRCLCPISKVIMKDPVVAEDGFSYERSAIERWLKKSQRSPMTNQLLNSSNLIPNQIVKDMISSFREQNLRDYEANLQNAQKVLLRLQTLLCCFDNYDELTEGCKKFLIEKNIAKDWDITSDVDKLTLLNNNGLQKYSYQFLRLDFKKYFKEITKYGIEEGSTCENFWNKNKYLQQAWVEQAYENSFSNEFSNEITLLQKLLIEEDSKITAIEETLKKITIQTACFLNYDLLKEDLKKQLKDIIRLEAKTKIDWDNKHDEEKAIFLQVQNVKSFCYLTENFRRHLSDITQKERRAINPGKHPNTEDYWNSSEVNLKSKWINEFNPLFKEKLCVLQEIITSILSMKEVEVDYDDSNSSILEPTDVLDTEDDVGEPEEGKKINQDENEKEPQKTCTTAADLGTSFEISESSTDRLEHNNSKYLVLEMSDVSSHFVEKTQDEAIDSKELCFIRKLELQYFEQRSAIDTKQHEEFIRLFQEKAAEKHKEDLLFIRKLELQYFEQRSAIDTKQHEEFIRLLQEKGREKQRLATQNKCRIL